MTQDESQKPIKDVEIALRYKAIGLGLQERLKVFSCLTIHKIIFQLNPNHTFIYISATYPNHTFIYISATNPNHTFFIFQQLLIRNKS